MAHQEQNPRVLKDSDEFGETNKSPPSTNTTYHSFSASISIHFTENTYLINIFKFVYYP